MSFWVVIAGIFILFLGVAYFRGDRKLKEIKKVESLVNEKLENVKAGEVTYQGGFPPMPKPTQVTVGVSEDYMVLYDFKGTCGKVDFGQVKKIEKITTRKRPDTRGRSFVLWGPLVPLLLKVKIQHFIVINYIDVNQEENNVLFQSKDAAQINKVYEELNSRWHKYKKKEPKVKYRKNGQIVGETV